MGIFGPTKKGGGLDMRFSSNKGGYFGKAAGMMGGFFGGGGSDDDGDDEILKEAMKKEKQKEKEIKKAKKLVSETDFISTDPKDIAVKIDDLLSAARGGISAGVGVSIFTSKIRSGILHLKNLNEHTSAAHYKKELNKLMIYSTSRTVGKILIIPIVILILAWLLNFLFFNNSSDYLNEIKETEMKNEKEFGCKSVEDCLAKDSTKTARKIYFNSSLKNESDLIKIIRSEMKINIINKNFEDGWIQLKKENLSSTYNSDLEKLKYEFLKEAVDNSLKNKKNSEAKNWALEGSTEHNAEGYTKTETSDFNEKETQRNLLLKRIKDYKRI